MIKKRFQKQSLIRSIIVKFDTNVSSKKFKGLILRIRLDSFVVSFKRINNTNKITNDTKKNSNTD